MIYFHIPFCKQACHYCDFHFSTSLKYKTETLQALKDEVTLRNHYLQDRNIHSIYFGGGTPSLLSADEIAELIDYVAKYFSLAHDAEITLEANPDDLDLKKVQSLKNTPINRFSIGIQSFFEEDLRWMNRAHNSTEAETAIKTVQDAGFQNVTADLIYGYPLLTNEKWQSNIAKLIDFSIPHISSYAMTIEAKTALAHFIKQGKTPPMQDAQSAEQMTMLIEALSSQGYDHYEISNFAKHQNYAKHNTNYWLGKHYLGIGPSAHSFNGLSRNWNISNNAKYIDGIKNEKPFAESENLSFYDRINEYLMTALRTMWGISSITIQDKFGQDILQHVVRQITPFIATKDVQIIDNHYTLTNKGKLLADHIASELFLIEDN